MLQFVGLQRGGHDLGSEQQQLCEIDRWKSHLPRIFRRNSNVKYQL